MLVVFVKQLSVGRAGAYLYRFRPIAQSDVYGTCIGLSFVILETRIVLAAFGWQVCNRCGGIFVVSFQFCRATCKWLAEVQNTVCTVHLDEFSRKQVAGSKFHDYILRFQPGCFAASGSGVIGGGGIALTGCGNAYIAGIPKWRTIFFPGVCHFAIHAPIIERSIGQFYCRCSGEGLFRTYGSSRICTADIGGRCFQVRNTGRETATGRYHIGSIYFLPLFRGCLTYFEAVVFAFKPLSIQPGYIDPTVCRCYLDSICFEHIECPVFQYIPVSDDYDLRLSACKVHYRGVAVVSVYGGAGRS